MKYLHTWENVFQSKLLERHCRVRAAAQTAVVVKALREALDRLLQEKVCAFGVGGENYELKFSFLLSMGWKSIPPDVSFSESMARLEL